MLTHVNMYGFFQLNFASTNSVVHKLPKAKAFWALIFAGTSQAA